MSDGVCRPTKGIPLTKVIRFPHLIPNQTNSDDPLQRAEKAVDTAHDLVRQSQNKIAEEIEAALNNLDSQLKLIGDMIDCIPDPSAREKLSSDHAILAAAGRDLRLKKDALGLSSLLEDVKAEIGPTD